MSDSYRHFHTNNCTRLMTVLFDNLFNETDILVETSPLAQTEIESLTDEEYSYFLSHGSLDIDAEVY